MHGVSFGDALETGPTWFKILNNTPDSEKHCLKKRCFLHQVFHSTFFSSQQVSGCSGQFEQSSTALSVKPL